MSPVLAVFSAWLLAQAGPAAPTNPATPAEPSTDTAAPAASIPEPAPTEPQSTPPPSAPAPAEPVPSEPPEEPPPLPPPPEPRIYGDQGMSELSLALGYSSASGFLAGGGYRRFLIAGLAPGVEASVQTGAGTTIGLLLGTLRVVPLRTRQFAFVLTGRAGRVLLSDHDDGWGAGGGAGVIVSLGANVGLELGYDVLWLLPSSFCTEFSSCTIQGPVIGLRLSF